MFQTIPFIIFSGTTKRNTSTTEESSLIKFIGEDSYFGQRRFQYSILGKLKLYVYSGDLLKLDNVEAIVVPLQPGMTGGALAEGVKKLGGDKYRKELEKNRYFLQITLPLNIFQIIPVSQHNNDCVGIFHYILL